MGVKNYISDMKLAPAVVCQKVLSFWFRGGMAAMTRVKRSFFYRSASR